MKKLWIAAIVLVVLIASGGGYVLWQRKSAAKTFPTGAASAVITPTQKSADLTTWTDEAGFTFQYPKGLTVNKHEEDQDNYAHVELTSSGHPGHVIIWVKDTNATTVDMWVKNEKTFGGANVLDSTLGNQPAKKVLITSPTTKTLTVGTISDGLLFAVEGSVDDAGYWSTVHNTILTSFALTPSQKSDTGGASSGGNDDAVDEEEVVE